MIEVVDVKEEALSGYCWPGPIRGQAQPGAPSLSEEQVARHKKRMVEGMTVIREHRKESNETG